MALEVAALRRDSVSALVLMCSALPGRVPSAELVELGERENALIEAGRIAAAAELMVDTWLGPEADDAAQEAVRRKQRSAFEVQSAATEEFEPVGPEVDLTAVRAPTLVLSGTHDLAHFRQITTQLPGLLPDARRVELPWTGHLPSLGRPSAITDLLVDYLRERLPVS
ncbi:alpha/beta fold hydrolase [Streptomyces bungoensis]